MRTQVVVSCLFACCLFPISSSFAQDSSELQTDTTVADTVPLQNPQGQGKGVPVPAGRAKPSAAAPAVTPYVFPTHEEMNRYWLKTSLGPKAFLGGAFTASWNQWVINSPSEWSNGAKGWGQRYGSALLDNGINTTSTVWISRATHQDPGYRRCDCMGFKPRSWHAVKMAFTSFNRSGDIVFSPAKVISPFTGPMVTRNTIYPDSFGFHDVLTGGPYYFAGSVAWNFVREFVKNF